MSAEDRRLSRLKALLRMFRFERFAYLLMSTCSCALLVWAGVSAITSGSADIAEVTGLVGGTGGMLLAIGKLLKMWDQALVVVFAEEAKDE